MNTFTGTYFNLEYDHKILQQMVFHSPTLPIPKHVTNKFFYEIGRGNEIILNEDLRAQ